MIPLLVQPISNEESINILPVPWIRFHRCRFHGIDRLDSVRAFTGLNLAFRALPTERCKVHLGRPKRVYPGPRAALIAKIAVIYICMVPIWQMIVTTLLGVYFMSERLMVMTEVDQ